MNYRTTQQEPVVEHAALSDVGLRRSGNQDSLAVALADAQQTPPQRGHLFLVADGMGAHAAGELASELAAKTVPPVYQKLRNRPPQEALREAVQQANSRIHSRAQASQELRGMGTTVSVVLLTPQAALVAHVGDSRVYRLRKDRLKQLTFDHSLVWEICAAKHISEADVPAYIPRNVITRSVGPNPSVEVDLEGPFPIEVGDTFLLCSDGLSGQLLDQELGTILLCLPPDEAVRVMVDLANLRGGPDNVTAVVVRVAQPQPAADADQQPDNPPKNARRPIRPWLQLLVGVLLLAALAAIALGRPIASLAALAGALLAGLATFGQRRARRRSENWFDSKQLGKGPYTSFDCRSDADFVDRLARTVRQLGNAAVERDWELDWDGFNELAGRAAAAAGKSDYNEAVGQYCRAISFMMDQVKDQRNQHPPPEDLA